MDFSQILQALGQGMSGGGQGGQAGGGMFGNWTQPTGSGLSAAQAQPLMPHSSGILQGLMAEPQQQFSPTGGLHDLLMRLGLMGPHQQ